MHGCQGDKGWFADLQVQADLMPLPPSKWMAQPDARLFIEASVCGAVHDNRRQAAFYGDGHDWDNAGWREMAAFSSCVLRPLQWAGLLVPIAEEREGSQLRHVFKTPLWRSAMKMDTDHLLQPIAVQ